MRKILLLIYSIPIFLVLFLPNVDAQTGIYPAPILLGPTNGQKLGREAVTFQWAWEGELAEDEYFCVEVWESQMEPTSAPLRLAQSTSLSVPAIDLLPGDYQWRVTVVRVADLHPEEELSELSETWSFSWGQAITTRILAWITRNIGGMLAWAKKNIVDVLVYSIVSLVPITAVILLSVLFVAELNQMPFRMAWGLMFDHKELPSAFTSGGNYLNERWKDWERIIDEEIDNVLLEEIYNVLGYVFHVELRIVVKDGSLERIPKTFRKYALHRYYDKYREKYSLEYLSEKEHGYAGLQLINIPSSVPRAWNSMIDNLDSSDDQMRSRFNYLAADFILSLTQTLRSVEREEAVRSHDYMYGYLVRLPILRLNIPQYIPIVFLQKTIFDERDVAMLVDFMKNYDEEHFFALLLTFDTKGHEGKSKAQLNRLINESTYAVDSFIFMDIKDICDILKERDKSNGFIQLIVERRDLRALSPYVIAGPVPEHMFFGRDREVNTILKGVMASNFALMGGRKIGKTSTLQQVYSSLKNKPQYFPLYLDCQATVTYEDFFSALRDKGVFDSDTVNFRDIKLNLQREAADKKVVILLDEVDDILNYAVERGEWLFKTFRALSQEGYCRFVFCGGKTLYQRIHHPRSPLFNFCRKIQLGELDARSAEEIIVHPMYEMNVKLEDGVVREIIRISSCHPNLVQYMCDRLIQHISSRHARHISLEDLSIVTTSRDFYEYFVRTTWGDATPLEKMITLCMLDRHDFSKQEIYAVLEKYGLQDRQAIEGALETLEELYCFFTREKKMYHYTWSEFPRIVRGVVNVEDTVKGLLEQIKW